MQRLFYASIITIISLTAWGTTFTVTDTLDGGPGTLRAAIDSANLTAGPHIVYFNIPGTGPHQITLDTSITSLTMVVIDGKTQPGYTITNPQIIIHGSSLNQGGLVIKAESSEITGLWFQNFSSVNGALQVNAIYCYVHENTFSNCYMGMLIRSGHHCTIQNNKFGTDPTGTIGMGNINNTTGIRINSGENVTVGGAGPNEGNLLSGNAYGVFCGGVCNNIRVIGNKVGTDITGTFSIPNGTGLSLGGDTVYIGGSQSGEANLVSGNGAGISASGTVYIKGNFIGTDITGTDTFPNAIGIRVMAGNGEIGGALPGEGNVISGNSGVGLWVGGAGDIRVMGNKIGTDISGTYALPNNDGVICDHAIIGGASLAEANVISGNLGNGISIGTGDSNLIIGNFIGTDLSGSLDLGNGGHGIYIQSNSPWTLGPDPDDAVNNIIGGTGPGEANYIVNNDSAGISIQGNEGTNNFFDPVYTYARYNTISANIIANHPNGKAIDLNYGGSYPGNDSILPPIILSVDTLANLITGTTNPVVVGNKINVYKSDSTGNDMLSYLGTATTNAQGDWSLTIANLAGFIAIVATSTDAPGSNAPNRENTSELSDPFFFTPTICKNQDITINAGWNMISSYISPTQPGMLQVFDDIANDILIAKNGAGQTAIPSLAINSIGNWEHCQGYKVKASSNSTLSLCGQELDPSNTSCQLNAGWNIISYLRNSPMDISTALNGISSTLLIAKDVNGSTYLPGLGINSIGNMLPGQGYKVKLSAPATLTYPAN